MAASDYNGHAPFNTTSTIPTVDLEIIYTAAWAIQDMANSDKPRLENIRYCAALIQGCLLYGYDPSRLRGGGGCCSKCDGSVSCLETCNPDCEPPNAPFKSGPGIKI